MRWRGFFSGMVLVVLAVPGVRGQTGFEPRDITRGVTLPASSGAAGDFDASAVSRNPAGLATLRAPALSFAYTFLEGAETYLGGGGWSLFLAAPLELPPIEGHRITIAYGFGFQGVRSPDGWVGAVDPGPGQQDGSYLLNSFAVGTPTVSLGWTIGTFFWAKTPQIESILTHHVGVSVRPSRFVAAGLTVRDVFEPVGRAEEEKFVRSFDTEIAVRPLGDWRFEIAGRVLAGRDDLVDFGGRVMVRPWPGFALFAGYQAVERRFDGPGADTAYDHRVGLGISIEGAEGMFGRWRGTTAFSYGALGASRGETAYAGSSVMAGVSLARRPALVEPACVVRMTFDGDASDRAFVDALLRFDEQGRPGGDARGVAGVVLEIEGDGWGWARAEDLREAIARLQARGVRVIAYLHQAGMGATYAASACDRVLLHPAAEVDLAGVAASQVFIETLLDGLGIGAQVVRIGPHKAGPDALDRHVRSQADRAQWTAYLEELAERFVGRVARARDLAPATVRGLFDRPVITPPVAAELGLVDEVAHPDGIPDAIEKLLGRRLPLHAPGGRPGQARQWGFPRIAVVHLEGDIVSGGAGPAGWFPVVSGDRVAAAIRAARKSPQVAAIVLRVASPGGVMLASERIAREVTLCRGKKPVVASLGDVAASGGYLAAAGADRVFAAESTLTGSIGVFAVKLHLERLLLRWGIVADGVQVGEHADADSVFRPWTEKEKQGVREQVAYLYDRFVSLVAEGRALAPEQVRRAGGGRIWSGRAARERGLVDRNAGLLEAVDLARASSGIADDTRVVYQHLPSRPPGPLELLTSGPGPGVPLPVALPPAIRAVVRALPPLPWWRDERLARLPWTP